MSLDKAANLRKFFADGANTTTRERIFFNRLSFDLKLAAARMGYHLHIYEPDVDRDGFDIVAEDDDDTVAWFQTKAVLASASTAAWDVNLPFLRPSINEVEDYHFDFVQAGRSGGVILIEIADDTADPAVTYRYTDLHVLAAIAAGMLRERPWRGRGKPAKSAHANAQEVMALLRADSPPKLVSLPKNVFVTVGGSDQLLGMMGLRSENGHNTYMLRKAFGLIQIDQEGALVPQDHSINEAAAAHHHLELLCAAQPKSWGPKKVTVFEPFKRMRLPLAQPTTIDIP